MIAVITFINCMGLVLVYFIVFGEIAASIYNQLFLDDGDEENILSERTLYVFALGLCLIPVVI